MAISVMPLEEAWLPVVSMSTMAYIREWEGADGSDLYKDKGGT
jgi:hypothetical protein